MKKFSFKYVITFYIALIVANIAVEFNPLMPELNPSAQRCLMKFFYWGFCFLNRAFH
jgi:hypothetical protein